MNSVSTTDGVEGATPRQCIHRRVWPVPCTDVFGRPAEALVIATLHPSPSVGVRVPGGEFANFGLDVGALALAMADAQQWIRQAGGH